MFPGFSAHFYDCPDFFACVLCVIIVKYVFEHSETVAAVVVAALMYQPAHPAVLRIIHHRNLIVDKNTSFLTVKKYPFTIHFIFEGK